MRAAWRKLEALSSIVGDNTTRPKPDVSGPPDPLRLSIDFNRGVALINAYHAGREKSHRLLEIRESAHRLAVGLELRLKRLDERDDGAGFDERSILAQFEAPMLGLWATLDLLIRLGNGEPYTNPRASRRLAGTSSRPSSNPVHCITRGWSRAIWNPRPLDSRTRYPSRPATGPTDVATRRLWSNYGRATKR